MRRLLPVLVVLLPMLVAQDQPEHVPVYIEDSPAAVELAETARDLQGQGRLTDAVATWQRVMEDYLGKLVPRSDGLFIEVARWAREQLAADADLLGVYRQMMGPDAERALAEAHRHPLDDGALEAVVRRYFLTPSGLEAGLDLAGLYLERADPAAAAALLDELRNHPDHLGQGARFHGLAAITALLLGDREAMALHEAELTGLGAAAELAEVRRFAEVVHPPLRIRPGTAARLDPEPALFERPLWRAAFEVAEPGSSRPNYPGGRQEPPLSTVPVADQERLYLNELTRVSALDRYSGRRLWTFEAGTNSASATPPAVARIGRTLDDRRGVLVLGDRVIAVVGQATNWPGRLAGEDRGTALAALDRETGTAHWRVTPQQLDATLERSYFQGTPLASYDRIFALVRRNQASGFQDVFVVSVDAATGALLWRRHVSSAVTATRYAMGSPPQMTLAGGTLYVGDSLAAVAAIDGRSGAVKWTRVLVQPGDVGTRGLNVGGDNTEEDAAPPVLVKAGLIVPPVNAGGRAVVLDPVTGEDRRAPVAMADGRIEYFLPMGEDVLAIGRQVTRFDGATLEPIWSMPVAPGSPQGVRGLADASERYLVVPTPDQLLVLSLEDGGEVAQMPLESGANVLALDGQLVLADTASARSLMRWERAYEALAAQLRAEPTNPRAGLALAHLAASLGRRDAVREGVDAALAALERSAQGDAGGGAETQQRDVFAQLLEFGQGDLGLDVELREELLGRAATISVGPEHEVAYHLALGGLLEELHRPVEAVEHYQAVLMSPLLSSQLYTRGESSRQAGLEAQRRLTELVEREGREIYAGFEQEAGRQLAELSARKVDAAALVDLAARFPLAEAASRALLAAGRLHAEQGRPADAVSPLRRAYERTDDLGTLAEAAGRLAEAYEQQGRPQLAVQWLRRVAREHPALRPVRRGAAVDAASWMSDLASVRGTDGAAPALHLPLGMPRTVRGDLLVPRTSDSGTAPGDRFLVRDGDHLCLYQLPDLALRWEAPLPAEDVELLAMDHEQVLVWSPTASTLWSMDTATGELAWPAIPARQALAPLGDPGQREAERPEAERRFLEMIDVAGPVRVVEGRVVLDRPARPEGYLLAVGESVVVLADRMGGLVGLDRHSGRTLWHHASRIEQVATLEAGVEVAVLAGIRNLGTEAVGGAIQVLDLLTGEPRLPLLEDKDTPQWTGLINAGGVPALAVSTADHVTAHRLADGVVVWRLPSPGQPFTGRGWVTPELLMLECNGWSLLAIEPAAGEVLHQLELGPEGRGGMRDIAAVDGQWQIAAASAAIALGNSGGVLWRDALHRLGNHVVGQWVSDRHVLLLSVADDEMQRRQAQVIVQPGLEGQRVFVVGGEEHEQARLYDLVALDRASGAVTAEFRLSLPTPERLVPRLLLENHALLQGAGRVVVLPGATTVH